MAPLPRHVSAAVASLLVLACTPPTGLSDGLDAPPPGREVPSGLNPALPSVLFPHAPSGNGWVQMGSLSWNQEIPFRSDPFYEPDNGTHLVNYGDDDPATNWGRQAFVVPDPDVPGSVKNALELRLPRGLTGGYGSIKIGQHPDHRANGPFVWDPALSTGWVYAGVYVRYSPGYNDNGNVGTKLLMLKSDVPENRQLNHMLLGMTNDGAGGRQLWPTYTPQYPFGRYQTPELPTWDLNDGLWHLVELLQGPNTPGQNNGTLEMWVDGELVQRWTNARFFDAGQRVTVNRIEIAPIFGGGANPVPADQWIRVGPLDIRMR
jgi:hypothetical protein